jgi:hypothetical protein
MRRPVLQQVCGRWKSSIDPAINREEWSPAEDDFIIIMQSILGSESANGLRLPAS